MELIQSRVGDNAPWSTFKLQIATGERSVTSRHVCSRRECPSLTLSDGKADLNILHLSHASQKAGSQFTLRMQSKSKCANKPEANCIIAQAIVALKLQDTFCSYIGRVRNALLRGSCLHYRSRCSGQRTSSGSTCSLRCFTACANSSESISPGARRKKPA